MALDNCVMNIEWFNWNPDKGILSASASRLDEFAEDNMSNLFFGKFGKTNSQTKIYIHNSKTGIIRQLTEYHRFIDNMETNIYDGKFHYIINDVYPTVLVEIEDDYNFASD